MDQLNPKDLQPQTMLGMKLIQQPFSKQPDAENLFDFDSLKQTRDTVSHHLQFSQLLMVIQAKKGGGKNSFANSLIVSEHPALYFFNATAESGDGIREILAKAATNNHADDIGILEKRIHDIMYRGQQPVLIINDADKLSDNELHDAIKYSQDMKDDNQQTQLKLLLLGDHSLEKKIETNGIVNHNQFYIIDLPQLNVSNTRAFLMHRLSQAGFRDPSPFNDKDITNIYNMANGNPVATMEYAAESLNNNKSLHEEEFGGRKNNRKIFILGAAALFLAAFIYNSLLSPELETSTEISEKIELPLPTDNTDSTLKEKRAIDQLFKSSSNTMDVKPQNQVETFGEPLAPAISIPTETTTNQPAGNTTSSTELDTLETIEVVKPEIKPAQLTELTQNQSSGIPLPVDSKPVTKNVEPLKTPAVKTQSNPRQTKTEAVKPAIDETTAAFLKAGTRSPDWLLQQKPGNWSLQILGAYKPETLLAFVHQHRLGNKVAYYKTRLGTKDWHVILYGQYASKEKAKAVIPYLPAYIRQNNPWAKDMKSVQIAIKKAPKR